MNMKRFIMLIRSVVINLRNCSEASAISLLKVLLVDGFSLLRRIFFVFRIEDFE